jgi:uncharacterized repeat protein (TIGR01451 family)
MRRRFGYLLLISLFLVTAGGCFGVTQNPSYFPYLLPFGDVIPTHAKPPGYGYFANFDPVAVRLEVRPVQATNPVRSQHVLIATVYDAKGQPRRDRRVEWILEGKGSIIEVDESGCFPGRGYKEGTHYAVSYTNYREHRFTRGNGDPADDFIVRPGQTWCVITAAEEGDSHVTVYAPGVHDWDKGRVFVTCRWVDAEWRFPPPTSARAGSDVVLTTSLLRRTDGQPLAGYRVRYTLLDGPPAAFFPRRIGEEVIVSDLSGNAHITLKQIQPALGVNRVGIEIIRPPDPTSPSGSGIVLAKGETVVEWLAAQVGLALSAPAEVSVSQDIATTATITNSGKVESRSMTVTALLPDGVQYVRSEPPAVADPGGRQLAWTFGALAPGQAHVVQLVTRPGRVGPVTQCLKLVTEEGFRDEKCATTNVTQGQLAVNVAAPLEAALNASVTYDITVANPGTGPAENVTVTTQFQEGLEYATKVQTLSIPVGRLAAGERKTVAPLLLKATKLGRLTNTVVATAEGGLHAKSQHVLTVREPKLTLNLTGPKSKYVDKTAEWELKVTNAGEAPLNNVVVRDRLPDELAFQSATQGGAVQGGEVVWNLGTLKPGEIRVLQMQTLARTRSPGVTHTATATAEPDLTASSSATIEILGVPASNLQVKADVNPAEVNKEITYAIKVTNPGSLPAKNVRISVKLSPELSAVGAMGTDAKFDTKANAVEFAPVAALERGQELNFKLKVRAVKAGDARCRVELRSDTSPQPEVDEVTTTVIDPANLQSAPPPAGGAKDAKPADVPQGKPGDNVPPPPPAPMNPPPAVSAPPASGPPPVVVPAKPLPKG